MVAHDQEFTLSFGGTFFYLNWLQLPELREKTLCVEDERDEWIEKFGRCNFAHSTRLSSLLTTIRSSMENLMSNQVSRMRTRNASAADVIDSASSSWCAADMSTAAFVDSCTINHNFKSSICLTFNLLTTNRHSVLMFNWFELNNGSHLHEV